MKVVFLIVACFFSILLRAAELPTAVVDSASLIGAKLSTAKARIPELVISSDTGFARYSLIAEGVEYTCSLLLEETKIVRVTWRPRDPIQPRVLAKAFQLISSKLQTFGSQYITESAAFEGVVLTGAPLTHKNKGASFFFSSVDKKLRIRIQMQLLCINHDESEFVISISGDEPVAFESNDPK